MSCILRSRLMNDRVWGLAVLTIATELHAHGLPCQGKILYVCNTCQLASLKPSATIATYHIVGNLHD